MQTITHAALPRVRRRGESGGVLRGVPVVGFGLDKLVGVPAPKSWEPGTVKMKDSCRGTPVVGWHRLTLDELQFGHYSGRLDPANGIRQTEVPELLARLMREKRGVSARHDTSIQGTLDVIRRYQREGLDYLSRPQRPTLGARAVERLRGCSNGLARAAKITTLSIPLLGAQFAEGADISVTLGWNPHPNFASSADGSFVIVFGDIGDERALNAADLRPRAKVSVPGGTTTRARLIVTGVAQGDILGFGAYAISAAGLRSDISNIAPFTITEAVLTEHRIDLPAQGKPLILQAYGPDALTTTNYVPGLPGGIPPVDPPPPDVITNTLPIVPPTLPPGVTPLPQELPELTLELATLPGAAPEILVFSLGLGRHTVVIEVADTLSLTPDGRDRFHELTTVELAGGLPARIVDITPPGNMPPLSRFYRARIVSP